MTAPRKPVAWDEIASQLTYCAESGVITRTVSRGKPVSRPWGSIDAGGYLQGEVSGKFYKVHRVAWLLHYGEWPSGDVDHINGVTTDNRISNLRVVTMAENQQNRTLFCRSASGIRGVRYRPNDGKWEARIKSAGKSYDLGLFGTKEAARDAYLEAKARLHTTNPIPRDISILEAMQ